MDCRRVLQFERQVLSEYFLDLWQFYQRAKPVLVLDPLSVQTGGCYHPHIEMVSHHVFYLGHQKVKCRSEVSVVSVVQRLSV